MTSNHSKIVITNPCSESWDAMKINDTGRFCDSCAKSVIDFTVKTDAEIESYLKEHKGEKLCGRFYKSQVDRIRIELDEQILYSGIPFWQKFLAIVLVCFGQDVFGYDFCFAQTEQDSIPSAVEQVDTLSNNIEQDSTLEVAIPSIDTVLPVIKTEVKTVSIACTPFLGTLTVSGSVTTTCDGSDIDLPDLFRDTLLADDSIESEKTRVDRDFSSKTPQPKTPKKDSEPMNAVIADVGERRQRKK